jgi:hypothetical protein
MPPQAVRRIRRSRRTSPGRRPSTAAAPPGLLERNAFLRLGLLGLSSFYQCARCRRGQAGYAGARFARSPDCSCAHCCGGWVWLARGRDRNHERSFTMAFQVEELSIQLIEALVPLMPRIKQRDRALEDQLRRAASSIGLNAAEAAFSESGQSAGATVYGCGKRGGDAACAAPGRGLAAGDGGRGRERAEIGGSDCRDPLEDDAGVSRAARGRRSNRGGDSSDVPRGFVGYSRGACRVAARASGARTWSFRVTGIRKLDEKASRPAGVRRR